MTLQTQLTGRHGKQAKVFACQGLDTALAPLPRFQRSSLLPPLPLPTNRARILLGFPSASNIAKCLADLTRSICYEPEGESQSSTTRLWDTVPSAVLWALYGASIVGPNPGRTKNLLRGCFEFWLFDICCLSFT